MYSSLEEFLRYDNTYGLLQRMGVKPSAAATLWDRNPIIRGSADPADFGIANDREDGGREGLFDVSAHGEDKPTHPVLIRSIPDMLEMILIGMDNSDNTAPVVSLRRVGSEWMLTVAQDSVANPTVTVLIDQKTIKVVQ